MPEIIRERQIEDLTGRKFGQLTVIERAEDHWIPCGRRKISWLCQCDCGSEPVVIRGQYLKNGRSQSCGCLQRERTSKSNLNKKKKRNVYDDMGDYLIGHFFNCEDCFEVDKDDYEKVKDYCWYKNTGGYVTTTSDGKTIKIHQVVMGGKISTISMVTNLIIERAILGFVLQPKMSEMLVYALIIQAV